MDRSVRAGILGSIISIIIMLFTPYYLYSLPSFVAAIVAIYFSRLTELKDGLLAAFMTYFIGSAVYNAVFGALFYGTPYSVVIDVSIVVSPLLDIVTAFLAGYIGVRFAQRAKPVPQLPETLKPLPPV